MPMRDPDFGWHYRCGNQIFTRHKLCLTNDFSYFLPNYKAYYPSFVYDATLALVYNAAGFVGISFLSGLIFALSALFFVKIIQRPVWIAALAFYLIFYLSETVFGLGFRPQVVSYLFFLITFFILQKSARSPRYLFYLPLLFFIWVNTHIGFFIGPLLLGFFIIDKIVKKKSIFSPIIITSFLVTLLNPFGINVYREILNHASSPLWTMIAEWVPPPFIYQVLIVVSFAGLIGLMIYRKSFSFFQFFCLVFFGYLALTARRNLPLYFTPAFLFAFDLLPIRLPDLREIVLPLLLSISFFIGIIQIPKTLGFSSSWNSYCRTLGNNFPCEALKNAPYLSGNIYASYEWGGFLIWQLQKAKVFVDGRMPAWIGENGKSPYESFLYIMQTQLGWNEKLHSLKTDYIFIYPDTFIDLLIKKEPKKYSWKETYRDEQAVIYKNVLLY